MPTLDQVLAIAGAAEGSFYRVGGDVDKRYVPSFANENSGLSFGTFQFDVATNTQGQAGFRNILGLGVKAKSLDKPKSDRIYALASIRNAGSKLTAADKTAISSLMATHEGRNIIDALDRQRAATEGKSIDAIIGRASAAWVVKKIAKSAILTPGEPTYLQLFAYLLASLNRYPANQSTFEQWLRGDVTVTKNAPAGGFKLLAPPTVEQMHKFFQSLRIWDGTQGSYAFLRGRLDPTLKGIGG